MRLQCLCLLCHLEIMLLLSSYVKSNHMLSLTLPPVVAMLDDLVSIIFFKFLFVYTVFAYWHRAVREKLLMPLMEAQMNVRMKAL